MVPVIMYFQVLYISGDTKGIEHENIQYLSYDIDTFVIRLKLIVFYYSCIYKVNYGKNIWTKTNNKHTKLETDKVQMVSSFQ